jgi:hypothetical protein
MPSASKDAARTSLADGDALLGPVVVIVVIARMLGR